MISGVLVRKLLVLIAFSALLASGVTPAQAASSDKIRLDPAPKIKPKGRYNDISLDLTEGGKKSNRSTTIRGRISGGNVKGQRVTIYATNTNLANPRRTKLGTVRLSSKGVFTKRFAPRRNHAGRYKIEIVKPARGRTPARTRTLYINAYQFVDMKHFYDAGTPSAQAGLVGPSNRERFANGTYYRQAFFANGGSEIVFNTAGYNCIAMLFKTGISYERSRVGGTFSVVLRSSAGEVTLVPRRSMDRGQRLYEPSKRIQKRMRASRNFVFRVDASSAVSDQRELRYVLGRPRVACTYPLAGGAPAPSRS